jgi:hypothetical protein
MQTGINTGSKLIIFKSPPGDGSTTISPVDNNQQPPDTEYLTTFVFLQPTWNKHLSVLFM